MSPTIFRHKNYRFFFFSKEESRVHVHVTCPEGDAKFWLEPTVSLADHQGLNSKKLNELEKIIKDKRNDFIKEWKKHFKS